MATDVNQPEVAVLMAVCNGRQWLPAQVDSILGQSGVDISLYLSIDPSKDESELYCRQLAESSDRVILLSGSGPGNAAANFFRLIRHVDINRYDYIALADQDDIWLDDKLRYAIQRLNEEKADGFSSSVEAFWSNGKRRLVRKDYPQRKWDYLFESPGPGCTFVLNSRLSGALRSNLISNDPLCQGLSFHDWYIYAFARGNGFSWLIDGQSHVLYRQHNSNTMGVNRGWRAIKSRLNLIFSGEWFEQALLTARCTGLEDSSFVQSWRDLDDAALRYLYNNAGQCRRRRRDQILFFLILVAYRIFIRVGKP